MGRITGVVDDRGKYIYITTEEMDKVTAFIKQQGRVTMAALAKASNSLINLNATAAATPSAAARLEDDDDDAAALQAASPVGPEGEKGSAGRGGGGGGGAAKE
jgi:hypothetical protein